MESKKNSTTLLIKELIKYMIIVKIRCLYYLQIWRHDTCQITNKKSFATLILDVNFSLKENSIFIRSHSFFLCMVKKNSLPFSPLFTSFFFYQLSLSKSPELKPSSFFITK